MKIKVYEDRYLVSEEINGSQYENLATTLEFEFPETINNIPISEFNKYIVFDINSEENQSLIIDNEYAIPYEITKLGNVTFYVKLEEFSEDENVTDKVIWISRGLEINFNKTEEGKAIIVTPEKLDAFNVVLTELNEAKDEVNELINDVETKLENDEFKGDKGDRGPAGTVIQNEEPTDEDNVIWVDEDDEDGSVIDIEEIADEIKAEIQPALDEAKENSETAIRIAKGANQSKGFENYEEVTTAFNVLPSDTYKVGQNIYIKEKFVPDLWVYEVFEENIPYTYTNNEEFIELVNSENGIRIGYYSLGELETQKVDLSEYTKSTDYATSSTAGVVKANGSGGITVNSAGNISMVKATENDIDNKSNNYKPIVPATLDYAVKKSLTNTTEEWTEEDKEKASALLGNAKDVYSLQETKTNKIWIDEKPIYRRVINFGYIPGGWTTKQHDIQNLETITFMQSFDRTTGGTNETTFLPYSTTDGTNYCKSITWINSTTMQFNIGVKHYINDCWVVIEYTKTTD